MKLQRRMLLVFAATLLTGSLAVFVLSRTLLLSNFQQLETEQTKQYVEYAVTALYESYHSLGTVANDYAYWDRTYEFMADPEKNDISREFQNGEMEGLGIDLIVIRDVRGKIVFAKGYDNTARAESRVPLEFLISLFEKPQLQVETVSHMPLDGLVDFPDAPYVVSTRPILTSQRSGDPRGVFLLARRFDENRRSQISDLTTTSLSFLRIGREPLPADFERALENLQAHTTEIHVLPISEEKVGGYVLIPDLFGTPFLILRVDTARPIYARGKLSGLYILAVLFCGGLLSSLVIFLFQKKYVVSRVSKLSREVQSIGERKAIIERVEDAGCDELSSLAQSINGMLAELEKSQAQLLLVAENIHQFFWIRDARSWAFEYISHAYEDIWGRSRDTLSQNPDSWQELLHPDDRNVLEPMKQGFLSGKRSEFHYRILSETGDVRWLWERTFPIFEMDGQLKQVVGITEDITDFKSNEEALLHAHQELEERVAQRTAELAERGELVKLLVDSTPGAIYGMDADGACTFCNPACLRLLGYSTPEELLGRNIHELIHHTRVDGSPYLRQDCPIFQSFHQQTDAHAMEEIFWKKDGTSFPVEYSSRNISQRGKVVGAVVSFIDITERKRVEMELRHSQKLEAVGRLAAGIAHEINTPIQFVGDNTRFLQTSFRDELNLIHKYEELHCAAAESGIAGQLVQDIAKLREGIEWDYLEEEIPRAMEQMQEGLGRVAAIVRGMKEFSHVDRTNEKAPVDLNRALTSTLIVARNELKYVADVETHFAQLPPVVCHLGDLNQVFLNLLVNAAHAIEEAAAGTGKKGNITVCTHQAGEWVEVTIADSGTGIPQEARARVFDPFFTTKPVGKGTGQGLALARAIVVEKHGGTLTFETEVGKGTTFIVRLPLNGNAVREEALV